MTSSSGRPTRGTRHSSPTSSSASTTRVTSTRTCTPGFYCVGCEAFKTESELVDGKCPLHDTEPEWIEEKNWFFRLSDYQERLLALYDERPDFVLPGFRYNEARSFIASGLQDFSISRAGQPWGVSIPWDPGQVAYVWADALVNYLSALTYARPGEDLRDRYWPSVRHLIGKDIIRFHCVFWPAMLLSAGYEVPHQIFVHGYLLLDDRKISKSLGERRRPTRSRRRLRRRSGPILGDASRRLRPGRHGLAREPPRALRARARQRSRAISSRVPQRWSTASSVGSFRSRLVRDSPVAALVEGLADDVARRFDTFDLTGALERIWVVVRGLNRHVESQAPVAARQGGASATSCRRPSTTSPTAFASSRSRSRRTSRTPLRGSSKRSARTRTRSGGSESRTA